MAKLLRLWLTLMLTGVVLSENEKKMIGTNNPKKTSEFRRIKLQLHRSTYVKAVYNLSSIFSKGYFLFHIVKYPILIS